MDTGGFFIITDIFYPPVIWCHVQLSCTIIIDGNDLSVMQGRFFNDFTEGFIYQ